jgi:hypothetical protein
VAAGGCWWLLVAAAVSHLRRHVPGSSLKPQICQGQLVWLKEHSKAKVCISMSPDTHVAVSTEAAAGAAAGAALDDHDAELYVSNKVSGAPLIRNKPK